MSLKSEEIWSTIRQRGPRWAVLSLGSAILLGVLDQFTGRIVPFLTAGIENYVDPPRFVASFTSPVETSQNPDISDITAVERSPIAITKFTDRYLIAQAGPGHYELRLRRARNETIQELVQVVSIEKRDQSLVVDTGERNWADQKALLLGSASSDPSSPAPVARSRLSSTRWSLAEPDYAALAATEDHRTRRILAAALPEVGVFENGSDEERLRVVSYWAAAGGSWAQTVSVENVDQYPWGGAFLAWVVTKADVAPPSGAAAFNRWRNWGSEIPLDAARPGMIAIFQITRPGSPQSRSNFLAGIVLRKQAGCIEIITGNVANRVVVTCMAAPLVGVRRPPAG